MRCNITTPKPIEPLSDMLDILVKFTAYLQISFLPPKPFATEVERQFLSDYSNRFAAQRRITITVGFCTFLAYLGFDVLNAIYDAQFRDTAFFTKILPLRLIGTVALAILTRLLFLPATQTSERYASTCVICCTLSTYLMLLALTYSAPYPNHYLYYYDGMLLVLLFLFGLSKLLAKPTLILVSVLLLSSGCVFTTDHSRLVLAKIETENRYKEHDAPIEFLVIFSLIGYIISLNQERTARHTFTREQELQFARAETEAKTAALLALKERSRLHAEQQNQDKSKFIADAAHDLRNVMQPIGMFLEVGLATIARGDIPATQEHLKEAKNAAFTLRNAVNAMLDISELESSIIKIHYSHFDLRLLAADLIKQNTPFADQQHVKLRLSKNRGRNAIVRSDRHHLNRILANLISNGIKYADPSKGAAATVAIGIVCLEKTIRIDIIDNGIGIPATEQKNVFKPLHQLNNPERNRDKGIGLGLSIVNTTVNLLADHQIKLTSTPGLGTRFSLSLPKGDLLKLDEPPQAIDTHTTLDGLYVLLVENDLLVKKSIVALLKGHGADYEAVSSLEELQTLLPTLERDPDMVITDYRLPDEHTAADVISTLTANFGYDLPTLIMTGETASLSELHGKRILRKPVEAKQLVAEISRLCRDQHNAAASV